MTKKIDVAQMQADLGNFSSEYETIRHDDLMQVLSRLEQAEQALEATERQVVARSGETAAERIWRGRAEQAEQAVARVREVHRPVSDPFGVSCAACIGDSRRSPYPCDTIRALDGDGRG